MRASAGRRFAGLVLAVGVAAAVAACEDAEDAAGEDAPATAHEVVATPRITWGDCPPLAEGATRDPRLTCGTVKVPLDYRNPGGAKIDVAVSKLPATGGKRRGVLLVNPGGPALPGLDTPGVMAPTLPASVLSAYDLIGFDPRGVEHSTPRSCGLADPSVAGLFPYPAADGSITANADLARADAKQCAAKAGKNIRYFTTANTARDLDEVRTALGEKKISYWGQSYGTYLGAVYESLFGDHVDKVILEGNVDPTKVWAKSAASWGKGMSERFPDAAAVAAAQDDALGLGATADVAGGTPTEADGQVLRQVFAAAPQTPGVPADNQATMFLALTCGDAPWSGDVDDYARRVAADREEWPLTAGMPANIWACAFWPKPVENPVTVTDKGPRDTLILQNRRDNATPWDDGLGLYKVLGHRAAFVGADNGGHYVYHEGSACVDKATVDFLTAGTLPDRKVYCTDVQQP